MEYREVMDSLAPCGISCQKCFAKNDGRLGALAVELQQQLGAFDRYAERFAALIPELKVFEDYPAFKRVLAIFAQRDCQGCRKGTCKYSGCGVIACYRRKGVDFCFQCDEFPCERTNFDPDLKRRWILMNNRMREVGVEAYSEETKDVPRYR